MWVYREMSRVDALARLALNELYTNIKIPHTDLLSYVKLHPTEKLAVFLGSTSSEQASYSAS